MSQFTKQDAIRVIQSRKLVPAGASGVTMSAKVLSLGDYTDDGYWEVSDETIGTIENNEDGTAIYTQLKAGNNIITYDDGTGRTGRATATSMPLHSHENLESGGPAYGTYKDS